MISMLSGLLFAAIVHVAPGGDGVEYKQPQIAVQGDFAGLTFGSANTVWFAASTDRGHSFSAPVQVATGGKMALGRHRGPRLSLTPKAIVISAPVGEKGGGADGDLIAWRSTDHGRTWSVGVKINDVPAAAREGLHGMAAGASGLIYAAWLDLREGGTKLYGSASRDGGATWAKNVLIYASPDGHICQCCHPSVAIDRDGKITVMFRNALGGSRDMYIASSSDGGSTFTQAAKSGEGTWKLNACPMDGGGIALGPGGKMAAAWRREQTIFVAYPGHGEQELGSGKDAAVNFGKNGVYAAWSSPDGLRALLPGRSEPILLAPKGGYVQLAGSDPVIAVWEQEGSISVQPLTPETETAQSAFPGN